LSETAFALARVIDDKTGPTGVAGSRGLSLFYIQLRDDEGDLKNIKIRRLKEKLGTKSLPTAELELCGTPARLVGQVGRGVATIATLFNITRIYSASASVASMRYAHAQHCTCTTAHAQAHTSSFLGRRSLWRGTMPTGGTPSGRPSPSCRSTSRLSRSRRSPTGAACSFSSTLFSSR